MNEPVGVPRPPEGTPPNKPPEAKPPMTPQQEAQAAIKGIFFESDSRLAQMPEDLQYGKYFSHGRGDYTRISGTFDGRHLELVNAPQHPTGLRAKADGQSLSKEEAQSLWEQINPIAEKFHKYQLAEAQALRELAEKQTRQQARQQAEEEERVTREHDLEDEKKRGEVRNVLDKNLEGMEISDEDKEFAKKVVEDVAELTVLRDRDGVPDEATSASVENVLRIRKWDHEGNPTPPEKYNEYNRRKDIVFRLLGADTNRGQVWQAGFGIQYIHSKVYDTALPTIIVREGYETEYQRVGSGSQIHIERNSMYAKA